MSPDTLSGRLLQVSRLNQESILVEIVRPSIWHLRGSPGTRGLNTHHWYTSFDSSYHRTWEDLAQEFLQHFAFNTGVDVQVINRPTEREQR